MRSHSLGFFPSGLCRVNGVCVADLHFSTSEVAAKGTRSDSVFISSLLIFFLSGTNTKALHQYTLPGKVAEVPWSKEMSLQVKIMKHLRDITNKKRKKQIELYIPTEVE